MTKRIELQPEDILQTPENNLHEASEEARSMLAFELAAAGNS